MDFKNEYDQAKNDLGNVKNIKDLAKLAWWYPLLAAVSLLLFTFAAHAFGWAAVVITGIFALVVYFQEKNQKPRIVNLPWFALAIIAAALAISLLFVAAIWWIFGALLIWGLISLIIANKNKL